MTDTALVTAFQNGDINAFNTLVWRWEKRIFNYIYRIIGNEETARDLCQNFFLKMFREIKKVRDPEKVVPWMYRIALNMCRDEMRRQKKQPLVYLDDNPGSDQTPGGTIRDLNDTSSPSPEQLAHNNQLVAILKKSLMAIPEEQREIIVMKQYQGLKFTEIADILGVSVNTAKSRLYYGLRALRKILESDRLDKEVMLHEM